MGTNLVVGLARPERLGCRTTKLECALHVHRIARETAITAFVMLNEKRGEGEAVMCGREDVKEEKM